MRAKFIIGIVSVGLVMAIGAAAGIEYRPYEAQHDMAAARALLASGQYQVALSAAEKAAGFGASGAPRLENAVQAARYLSSARSLLASNRYAAAIQEAEKAATFGQAQTAVQLEHRAQALETSAQHYALALQAIQQQQWVTAASELRQVIRGSPSYVAAQERLTYIQTTLVADVQADIASSSYNQALAKVTVLLQIFPGDSTAQGLKAQVESGLVAADVQAGDRQLGAGNDYAAEDDFNNALAINPNDAEATLDLGLAYYQSGNVATSITYFQNAAQMLSQAGDYANESIADYDLGLAYYNTNDYPDAATAFQAAVNADPSDTQAQNYLTVLQNAGY